MTIAIITGASSGMGAEFCRQLDSRGLDSIWLVARRQDRMEELSKELKTPARIFTADLTDKEQINNFINSIVEDAPRIQYLVNCAGFGKFGMSWELDGDVTRAMIDLNVNALVAVTNACIPYMIEGGHIIELCSASAYIPMYDLNVYASSKAFVKHFCTGLRNELKSKRVSVTEVSPGWVSTEFIDITKTETSVPDKVFKSQVKKEDVVRKALIAADKGKRRSVCGVANKCIVGLATHCPNFASWVWKGFFH